MSSTRKYLISLLIASMLISGCSITGRPSTTPSPSSVTPTFSDAPIIPVKAESVTQAALPNPASVFCEQQGGIIEIRTDSSEGQYGVCIFQDGSECDEWAYFRGECKPNVPASTASTTEGLKNEYINNTYGFSISAPESWAIEEHPDYLILNKSGYRFFLGFQGAGEEAKPFRTGMPEGDFVDGGSATLLGQAIPKQILVFEGKNKVVSYGGRIKAGNLILVMYLDGVESAETGYRAIDIPPEVIAEGDQIIASIALKSGDQPKLEFNP